MIGLLLHVGTRPDSGTTRMAERMAERMADSAMVDSAAVVAQYPHGSYAALVCKDFYTAVNGSWLEHTTLTALEDTLPTLGEHTDTASVSSWVALATAQRRIVSQLLTQASAAVNTTANTTTSTTTTAWTRVLGLFYKSCRGTPPPAGTVETDSGVTRCVAATYRELGDVLAHAYIASATTPAAIARVRALAEQLRAAMAARFRALPWMTAATKREALTKLAQMRFLIAMLPEDSSLAIYDTLTLSPTDYTANLAAVQYAEYLRTQWRDNHPRTDRLPTVSPIFTINAFYGPEQNTIDIPVALFHEPWFNPHAGAAEAVETYAGLGVILGHEMAHAFDREGFHKEELPTPSTDSTWTPAERTAYRAEVEKLKTEYDHFVVTNIHVSGAATLHENVADVGGVNVALDVYLHTVARHPQVQRNRSLTPTQQFFLTYAAIWRMKTRPERRQQMEASATHADQQWRVNGVLMTMPAFAQAFGCHPGDAMVLSPTERARLW